jgi:hypothetical protein
VFYLSWPQLQSLQSFPPKYLGLHVCITTPGPRDECSIFFVEDVGVRFCRIKTMPHVERKDLLVFLGGAKPWGRERESLVSDYLRSPNGTGRHAWLVE